MSSPIAVGQRAPPETVRANGLSWNATVPVPLDTLQVTNGVAASDALFRAKNRFKRLDLSVNDGPPIVVELPDQMAPFNIKLPESKEVVLTIRFTIRRGLSWD